MDTRRLFRTSGVALAAALLVSGCTLGATGSGGRDASGSPAASQQRLAGSTRVLEPLPEDVPAELERYYGQELDWRTCSGAPGFECATLRVPLDYGNPDPAEDLELAVTRKRATGPGKRLGSLHVNPGGPGSSAVDYARNFAGVGYPEPVRARYDIVGMDPRGVARSEPVECLTGEEMDAHTRVDVTPDDRGEVGALTAAVERFGESCRKREGELLGHVSTVEAARDMDLLRSALGDGKLTYVGASYGTFLGATYAGLFPSRVGRMVLDGAIDPSLPARQLNRDQTAGFETAFTAFAEDCVERSDCPLGSGSVEDAAEQLSAFLEEVDAEPLDTGRPRELTESLATIGVLHAMYTEYYWPRLRSALAAARKGDGAELLALSDEYYDRRADGSYGNIMYANTAVNCLDLPAAFGSPAEVRKAVSDFEQASPVFGRNFAWSSLNCTYWPEQATGEAHRIEAEGAAPILVLGTTRDPATPYVWAEGLAEQLASGVLLTYDGDGHTAYARGSDCIDTAVNTYLLRGKTPKPDTVCS